MRNGIAATGTVRGHPNPSLRVPADRTTNRATLLLRPSLYQGYICLVDFARGKLLRQFVMRCIVLGNDHEPAGGAVEAVNDPGTQFAANFRQCPKMMEKRIDQRAAVADIVCGAGARMHHHAGGFVDDGEIVVFIHDVERNLLRKGAQWRSLRRAADRNLFPAFQPQRRACSTSSNQHLALCDQLLNTRTTNIRQFRYQILVQPLPGIRIAWSKCDW